MRPVASECLGYTEGQPLLRAGRAFLTMKTYSEKLKDPRWQRKRLEIMQRDNFACTQCGDAKTTLNVHHWQYSKEPWDVKNEDLTTVCRSCHEEIEQCKDLTKDFLRQFDFRNLVLNINRILIENGNVFIDFDCHDLISIYPQNVNVIDDQIAIPDGYRLLDEGEIIEAGDEFKYALDSNPNWHLFGNAVGNPYNDLIGCAARRRKIAEDALSDFDRMIESAPNE